MARCFEEDDKTGGKTWPALAVMKTKGYEVMVYPFKVTFNVVLEVADLHHNIRGQSVILRHFAVASEVDVARFGHVRTP